MSVPRIKRSTPLSLKDKTLWDDELVDQICKKYKISRTRFKQNYGLYNYYVSTNMNNLNVVGSELYRNYNAFFVLGVARVVFEYDVLERDYIRAKVLNPKDFPEYKERFNKVRKKLKNVLIRIRKVLKKGRELSKLVHLQTKQK